MPPTRFRSEQRLRRIEQVTDIPLLLLALALIPLLLAPSFVELSTNVNQAILVADWFIWACFTADFGVKLLVAPNRLRYLQHHLLEAAMLVLPFLRPLRVLRVLRLARVAVALGLNAQLLSDIASQRGTKVIVAAVLGILVVGASFTFLFERGQEDANLTSYGDALWWAGVTMTTVGYGDYYPVSAAGRGVALALMLFGIAALSALTATVAAYLVRESNEEVSLSDLMRRIDELHAEVRFLRAERQ